MHWFLRCVLLLKLNLLAYVPETTCIYLSQHPESQRMQWGDYPGRDKSLQCVESYVRVSREFHLFFKDYMYICISVEKKIRSRFKERPNDAAVFFTRTYKFGKCWFIRERERERKLALPSATLTKNSLGILYKHTKNGPYLNEEFLGPFEFGLIVQVEPSNSLPAHVEPPSILYLATWHTKRWCLPSTTRNCLVGTRRLEDYFAYEISLAVK